MTQPNDLTIYSEYANEWWTPKAPRFKSLQNITPFRLELIDEMIGNVRGKTVLDLGCGGGLLSVPLLDRGAHVIGMDLSAESIAAARAAAGGRGTFFAGDVCSLPFEDSSADVVIMADVLDHIPHFARAIKEAARVLRPGGTYFAGTLNRTWLSWFLTVFLGERLGYIPRGTHDARLFIQPRELIDTAAQYGLVVQSVQGEWPCFLKTIRKGAIALRRSRTQQVAYSAVFTKVDS